MAKRGVRGQKYGIQPKPARDIRRRVYYQSIFLLIPIIKMIGAQIKIEDPTNNLTYEERKHYKLIYRGLRQAIQGIQHLEQIMRENDPVNR